MASRARRAPLLVGATLVVGLYTHASDSIPWAYVLALLIGWGYFIAAWNRPRPRYGAYVLVGLGAGFGALGVYDVWLWLRGPDRDFILAFLALVAAGVMWTLAGLGVYVLRQGTSPSPGREPSQSPLP